MIKPEAFSDIFSSFLFKFLIILKNLGEFKTQKKIILSRNKSQDKLFQISENSSNLNLSTA